jgi:acid phosphatase (class A)
MHPKQNTPILETAMNSFAKRLALTAGLTILLAAGAASAQTAAPTAPKPAKALQALTAAEIDAQRLIAPPPAEGSAAHRAELAELHRVIAAATPARLAQAKWDDEHEDPSLYYATIGGGFDLKTLPATAALLDIIVNDDGLAATAAKHTFPRLRPWASDKTIPTCDPDDKPLTSYPSGHATLGFSVGMVLATLIPEKAQAIQARAQDYAFSREVCGSHYASDTAASHALANAITTTMLANPALQPRIAAARAELRAARFTTLQ